MFFVYFSLFFVCIVFITVLWTLYSVDIIKKPFTLFGSSIFGAIIIFAIVMIFITFSNELVPTDLDTCEQKRNYYEKEGELPLFYLDEYIFECI